LKNGAPCSWEAELEKDDGYFDIIAIGMQEASFEVSNKSGSSRRLNSNHNGASANSDLSSEDEDVEEEAQEQNTSVRAVAGTLGAVATATAATAQSATKKLINQAVVKPGKDIRSALGTIDGTNNNLLYQTATELYGMDTTYLRTMLKDRCPSYQIRYTFFQQIPFSSSYFYFFLTNLLYKMLFYISNFKTKAWIICEERCVYLF
jgi:hypothetical protein